MKLGICGLPLAGKTTVFNALTGAHRAVGGYDKENHPANVRVPDPRITFLSAMYKPEKTTPATIDYLDIPGVQRETVKDDLVRVLTALRDADALVHVVRFFKSSATPHPHGTLDPLRDKREFEDELIVADLDVVEKRLQRIEKDMKHARNDAATLHQEYDVLSRCRKVLEGGGMVRDLKLSPQEEFHTRCFQFLTAKPTLLVLNVDEDALDTAEAAAQAKALGEGTLAMCGELEMEISELEEAERPEFMKDLGIEEPCSDRVIRASYTLLGLRSFFTVGEDEVRAWTIHAGDDAVTAAGKVHSDIARGFIRAEVMHYDALHDLGGEKEVKAAGKLRLEGRGYKVADGDIINFRFNV